MNTKEEIEKSLETLESFNKMLHERHVAYYEKKISLNEFYILGGAYWLDTCGNCWKGEKSFPTFEKVLEREEYKKCLKLVGCNGNDGMRFSGNVGIPPSGKICPICKREWTIENFSEAFETRRDIDVDLKDFIGKTLDDVQAFYNKKPEAAYVRQSELAIRNDRFIDPTPKKDFKGKEYVPTIKENERGWADKKQIGDNYIIQPDDDTFFNVFEFFHKKCYSIKKESAQLERFKELFKKAGFDTCSFKPVPNQYCPCEYCTSWFEVQTPLYNFIIGDRKRVTNIEWDADIDGKKLFKDENVTKEEHHIHAWTDEKVVEYLAKVREQL